MGTGSEGGGSEVQREESYGRDGAAEQIDLRGFGEDMNEVEVEVLGWWRYRRGGIVGT